MIRKVVLILILASLSGLLSAQASRAMKEAKRLVFFGNYQAALPYIQMLYRSDTSNAYYNYLLGHCLFQLPKEKPIALPFLKRSVQSTSATIEEWSANQRNAPHKAWLFYGMSLHHHYRFALAIQAYKKYLTLCEPSEKPVIEQYIFSCESAMKIMKDSIEISIENLGNIINSEWDEHTPVISSDETTIIFTSRRQGSTGNVLTDDGKYFEDIYIAKQEYGRWSAPVGISPNINTPRHEASITLSYDGTELFIYKDDFGIGNIYYSKLKNNEWSVPVKLGSNINTQSNETHASLSPDGQMLIFTSDRPGGIGGKDLYSCQRLPNGDWAVAVPMSDAINTPFEEEGPFFHPDGYTLYFSSTGHNTIGGYDLFYCELQPDGSWSKPVNMGYPINTTDDELFYVLSADGKRAYFSSLREEGFGGKDLYVMNLLSLPEKSSTVIKGVVKVAGTNVVPEDLVISVKDLSTKKLIGKYKPNRETGVYTMILKQGRDYEFTCETPHCRFTPEVINIPDKSAFNIINKPIELNPIGVIEKTD